MKIEEPVVTATNSPLSETEENHPAYAMIGAHRVNGSAHLVGSEFKHNNFISLKIKNATKFRSLSRDWWFGRKEYIEVYLSEAQWATMISSLNTSDGVPCTLSYFNGEGIPGIPAPVTKTEQFKCEAEETIKKSLEDLDLLQQEISKLNTSKKTMTDLLTRINTIKRGISGSVNYVGDSFGKYMETVTQHAKIEVEAYTLSRLVSIGLDSVKSNIKGFLGTDEK